MCGFLAQFSHPLMIAVQLLQKLSISAAGKRDKLFRVIKNPVTQYLPVDSRKIGELTLNIYPVWLLLQTVSIFLFSPSVMWHLAVHSSGFSYSSEKLVDIQKYVTAVKDDVNFVFVVCVRSDLTCSFFLCFLWLNTGVSNPLLVQVGAMAHGKVDDEYVEDYISSKFFFEVSFVLWLLGIRHFE